MGVLRIAWISFVPSMEQAIIRSMDSTQKNKVCTVHGSILGSKSSVADMASCREKCGVHSMGLIAYWSSLSSEAASLKSAVTSDHMEGPLPRERESLAMWSPPRSETTPSPPVVCSPDTRPLNMTDPLEGGLHNPAEVKSGGI